MGTRDREAGGDVVAVGELLVDRDLQPAEGVATGTVIDVYQPGYRLGDDVVRAAKVVVAA